MKKIKWFVFTVLTFVMFIPITFANTGQYYETDTGTYMLCGGALPGCIEVTKGQSGVEFNLNESQINYGGHSYNFDSLAQENYYQTLYGKTRMFYYLDKNEKYVLCDKESSCKSYTFDKLMEMKATISHPKTISLFGEEGPGVKGKIYYFSQEQQDAYTNKTSGTPGGGSEEKPSGGNTVTETENKSCTKLKEPLKFIGNVVLIIKIAIPIIIIIFGMIDFIRAMVGSKDDEIKKSFKLLIFRCLAGLIIFLIPTVVSVIFSLVDSWANIKGEFNACQKCILNVSKCK